MAVLIVLCLVTRAAFDPEWIGKAEAWVNKDVKDEIASLRKWFCADLSYSDISHKPDDWLRLTDADRENLVGVKGALLAKVNLRGANGTGAFLAKATLTEADLQGANFSEADLRKSSLNWAKLRNAQLEHADLSGAHLDKADLPGAKLKRAIMPGATLFDAQLNDADMFGTRLQNANLEKANLEEANLGKANLAGTILKDANVRCAGFGDAWFQETELQGVDLSQAKDLTREQLEGACGDKDTKLPFGFGKIKDCGTRN